MNWDLHREDLMTPEEWQKLRSYLDREEELARARESWTALQNRVICGFLVGSGLRRAEAAALKLEDLNLKNDLPFIVVRHGKGDKFREVLISPSVRAMLKQFLRDRQEKGIISDFLFVPQRGTNYTPDGIYRVWVAACAGAGIPHRSAHKARHLSATVMYSATKDLRFVQKQLGHSRLTTTQVYIDVMDGDSKAHLIKFDSLLNRSSSRASRVAIKKPLYSLAAESSEVVSGDSAK